MKNRLVVCIALGLALSSTTAFARGGMGGMGMSHMGSPPTGIGGGSFGTSPYAPGTNSLGTALPSSGMGKPIKGPLLGTSPAVDREEAEVEKMLGSICRGC
jgi:hypothetical protein